MPIPLRALFVEDSETDTSLAVRLLEKHGYHLDWKRVETAAQLRNALSEPDWDVIISDFSLPGFNATAALEILKESGKDIPFLVMSGTIGEETAVGLMKSGASDYMLKDNLLRLPPAVERELAQAKIRNERVHTAEALRQSEIKYRQLYESMIDAFISVDMSGRILQYNRSYREMLGYSDEELLRLTYTDITPARWREFEDKIVAEQIVARGYSDVYEKEYIRKDGSVFPVELRTSLIRDKNGHPTAMWAIVRDITERKKIEEALRTASKEWQGTFDAVSDSIMTQDIDGRILRCNEATNFMLGMPENDIIGKVCCELVHHTTTPIDNCPFLRMKKTLCRETVEMLFGGKWLGISVDPVVDADGNLCGAVHIMSDITERKQAEEQMRLAKEEAEAASRAKSEFLANMSHELRTPLTAVIGFTDLLLSSNLDKDQRHYGDIVYKRACDLLSLIGDILDLAKIEAEKIEILNTELDVTKIVSDAVETIQIASKQKGLALRTSLDANVPRLLKGDSLRLKQILVNLLGNAVKFTEQGEIHISIARHVSDSSAHGQPTTDIKQPPTDVLLFSVSDTGIGIPADKLGTIFAPFVQVDGSNTRKFGGAGLGLAICQRLIKKMGGRIWVESEFGKGTTFSFELPFKQTPPPETHLEKKTSHDPRQSSTPPLRILLAEDDPASSVLTAKILSLAGHSVRQVNTGKEAVEAAAHEQFDLVFMDIRMPDMAGTDATAAIRKMETEGSLPGRPPDGHLPIIAFTALAMTGDKERFLAAGMDDYISKPVLAKGLIAAVERNRPSFSEE